MECTASGEDHDDEDDDFDEDDDCHDGYDNKKQELKEEDGHDDGDGQPVGKTGLFQALNNYCLCVRTPDNHVFIIFHYNQFSYLLRPSPSISPVSL